MAEHIDGPLYYETMGKSGPVMAFVHPNPMDQSCWIPIAAEERTFKKPNDGCASSRHMRRYREPFPVLLRPAIGVAPVRLLPVRRGVTGRRMDDGEVAHDADLYVMRP